MNPKNWQKHGAKSFPNQQKSCHLQLRVHPAAPMVPQSATMASQGTSEVAKWLPKVFPKARKAPSMSKRKHQDPQMPIPRSQSGQDVKERGPAAEGVALRLISKNCCQCDFWLINGIFENVGIWEMSLAMIIDFGSLISCRITSNNLTIPTAILANITLGNQRT